MNAELDEGRADLMLEFQGCFGHYYTSLDFFMGWNGLPNDDANDVDTFEVPNNEDFILYLC